MRVLIVDDHPTNLELLRAVLEGDGMLVFEAANGVEALELLESESVDAIISDILMPRMDGYRLCQEVRSNPKFKDVAFLIYTATYTSPSDEKLSREIGADKYIIKPASSKDLIGAIHDAVEIKDRHAPIMQHNDVLREYSERLIDKLEKKNLELASAAERLALQGTALETAANAIIITDADGVIQWVNPSFTILTGFTPREAVGQTPRILNSGVHPPEFFDEFWRTIKAGQTYRGEFTNRRKDGRIYFDDHTITPVRSREGKVTHFVGIMNDITDRKRAESVLKETIEAVEEKVAARTAELNLINEELQRAKQRADMANEEKSHFLSRMSHELRTPMNAILGFGQLLDMTSLDAQQKESVQQILSGGRHLLSLINDVLEISRVEVGALGISMESVSLEDVLGDSVSLMGPEADQAGVVLRLEEPLPPAVVADRQRLKQVMLNLISNGIKFNSRGGTVDVRASETADGLVLIEVIDTGIGISPAQQEKLFVPFERLGAEGLGIEGTGLGLSLSKSLTEAMGGSLKFESIPGKGSRFMLRFAMTKPEQKSPEYENIPAAPEDEAASALVLAIEDNPTNIQLLVRVFAHRPNFELVSANQGGLGLSIAAERKPDVVLLDLHLLDMSGRDVQLELKKNPQLRDVPVIIVSADAYAAHSDSLLAAGAFRYVAKPFDLTELMAAIDAALSMADN